MKQYPRYTEIDKSLQIIMRKTLEDIIPPSRRRAMEQARTSVNDDAPKKSRQPRQRRISYKPAIIAAIVIVFAIGALFIFSGAQVEVVPLTNTAPLSLSLTAYASSTSKLPFAILTIEKAATQEVPSTGVQKISRIASGEITIYNTLSHKQKLLKKTRLASPSGLIFYTHGALTIPATHGIIPGSITVPVYASSPGSEYNIKPSPFSVPGLVGTSLENKIYAKSTKPMTGGYAGEQPTVSSTVASAARITLRKALAANLFKSVKQKVPSEYVLLSGAATTTFADSVTEKASSTGQALVRESGTITAIIFPESALARTIESHIMGTYAGQPVRIANKQAPRLVALNGFPNKKTSVFNFSLSGETTIVWVVNTTQIASAITGKTRDEAKTILKTFPAVGKAYISLKPFWVKTFPTDPKKINVTVRIHSGTGANVN